MIASWPGSIPTVVSRNAPANSIDPLPTFYAAAGVQISASARLDGIGLLPHLREGRSIDDRGALFWQIDLYRTMQRLTPKPQPYATEAVSRGNWKLLAREGTPLELFNLADDVGESDNRLAGHTKIAAEQAGEIRTFLANPRDWSGFPPKR